MKVGLDASVVLRLLLGSPEEQARQAEVFLDSLQKQGHQPVVSDLVVAEVYRRLHYEHRVPPEEIVTALKALFEGGEVKCLGVAVDLLKTGGIAVISPGFLDRLIHRQYQKDAEQMASFDQAAQRLNGVKVLR